MFYHINWLKHLLADNSNFVLPRQTISGLMLHIIGEPPDSTSCIQATDLEPRSKADCGCGSRTVCNVFLPQNSV